MGWDLRSGSVESESCTDRSGLGEPRADCRNERCLEVLLLARDSRWGGGVVNFIDMLSANLSAYVRVERHEIGQRPGDGRFAIRAARPVVDGLRLVRRLRSKKYDVIHINPSLNKFALLRDAIFIFTARLMGNGRVLVFFHGWDLRTAETIKARAAFRYLFNRLIGTATKVVVLASRFKTELIEMGVGPDRIEVLTTMFDGSIFDAKEMEPRPRKMRRVLFLSRLVKEKGIYELLEAFKSIKRIMPDAELLLAGDGEEKNGIERWVRDNGMEETVRLLGYVRGKEKGRVMMDADVFVLPTRHGEGCPVAILEAMAAGLPIITTGAGGILDVVASGKNGIVLNEDTPGAIERALVDVLRDMDHWHMVGRTNRKKAWCKYEARVVSAKLESIYRALQQ